MLVPPRTSSQAPWTLAESTPNLSAYTDGPFGLRVSIGVPRVPDKGSSLDLGGRSTGLGTLASSCECRVTFPVARHILRVGATLARGYAKGSVLGWVGLWREFSVIFQPMRLSRDWHRLERWKCP
jgi:hypothetical protein